MNSPVSFLPQTGFVRKPVVLAHVPFGPTKLFHEIKAGRFPAPLKFGERVAAWRAEDIRAWIAKQGQSQGEAA
jgi:predicted DNA-binding transcriptional regulator AlpA